MICEIYNKMEKIIAKDIFGYKYPDYQEEITLTMLIAQFIVFIILLLLISWWIIPGTFLFRIMNEIKFRCDK